MRKLDKRRAFVALMFITLMLGILLVRLCWIQLIATESFTSRNIDLVAASVRQRSQRVELDSGRGQFVDRYGRAITGVTYPSLLVFPITETEADKESLVEANRQSGEETDEVPVIETVQASVVNADEMSRLETSEELVVKSSERLMVEANEESVVKTSEVPGVNADEESATGAHQESGVVTDGEGIPVATVDAESDGESMPVAKVDAGTVTEAKEDAETVTEAEAGLLQLIGADAAEWRAFRRSLTGPSYWLDPATGLPIRLKDPHAAASLAANVPGVLVVGYTMRYIPPYPAQHLLGYIGQNPDRIQQLYGQQLASGRLTLSTPIGAQGLEQTFQPFLMGIGGTEIVLYTDTKGRPFAGLGYRVVRPDNPFYPLQVMTTLDLMIQLQLEQLADREGLQDGAIVVLDAKTAEVVALVSRPRFDPYRVDPGQDNWENRAVKAAIPGSIFKTVVAAAALETGAAHPEETFNCNGEWGHYRFRCWKEGGHGTITFRQGYAESCNIVFGEVMSRLSADTLAETAAKLGVGQTVGWRGPVLHLPDFEMLDGEEPGQLWGNGTDPSDPGVKLQTAIGQRDVRMSPLQAANMVVTLLNGGRGQKVRAVQSIRLATGQPLADFPAQPLATSQTSLSPKTAATLLSWMEDVVEVGTGASLQGTTWKVAGKSGTAQLGASGEDGVNNWFVGFGPVEAPRYAVAVVSLRQPSASGQAIRLFRLTMELLAEAERKQEEQRVQAALQQ